ncbi:hypothetical protein [Mesorhizobium sp.]|uniref:hypothetical protein n=1 Tax=Mesorhizobium sp. TaxID=1871066 RepID=UPI0025865551|nr:hypothetical protein [Mesorhizobium sp.]
MDKRRRRLKDAQREARKVDAAINRANELLDKVRAEHKVYKEKTGTMRKQRDKT